MKVSQSKGFTPVNITLESYTELQWLVACLNCSGTQAESQAENAGFKLDQDCHNISYKMWMQIREVFENCK